MKMLLYLILWCLQTMAVEFEVYSTSGRNQQKLICLLRTWLFRWYPDSNKVKLDFSICFNWVFSAMIINKKIFLPNFPSSLSSWNHYYYWKNFPFHIFTITISLCTSIHKIKLWSTTHSFCFIISDEHLDLYSASQVVSASSAQSPLQICFHILVSVEKLTMTVDCSGLNLSRICEETHLRSQAMAFLQEFKPVLGSAQNRLSSASVGPCG